MYCHYIPYTFLFVTVLTIICGFIYLCVGNARRKCLKCDHKFWSEVSTLCPRCKKIWGEKYGSLDD